MQLDDILPLLIIAISIIVSVARTINSQGKQQPRPPQDTNKPDTNRPTTGLPRQGAQPASTQQPSTQQPQPSGDLQKRLEEAQRRVQQAMQEQSGNKRQETEPPPLISGGLEGSSLEGQTLEGGSLETSGGLLAETKSARKPVPTTFSDAQKDIFRPMDTINRTPSDFQQSLQPVQPFIAETNRSERRQHQDNVNQGGSVRHVVPLGQQTERVPTTAPKHAKIGGSELLSPEMLTEKELLRGFLWQQILSEPRSKTKLRMYPMQRAKKG
ncbi:MAG: hypothetical protein ACRCYY_15970 [Trueperaceae bacterium]